MPDQNHPAKVPGLTSGAYPNHDHPNTVNFDPEAPKVEAENQPEAPKVEAQ